jgi:hypothetical protein
MSRDTAPDLQKASPRDILHAWQDGEIGDREAMELTGCESLFELYQACRSSGVVLRSPLTEQEMRGVEAILSDLLDPMSAYKRPTGCSLIKKIRISGYPRNAFAHQRYTQISGTSNYLASAAAATFK